MKLERRQKKKIVPKSAGRVATMNTALHWRGGRCYDYQNTVHMIKIDTIVEVLIMNCVYLQSPVEYYGQHHDGELWL